MIDPFLHLTSEISGDAALRPHWGAGGVRWIGLLEVFYYYQP